MQILHFAFAKYYRCKRFLQDRALWYQVGEVNFPFTLPSNDNIASLRIIFMLERCPAIVESAMSSHSYGRPFGPFQNGVHIQINLLWAVTCLEQPLLIHFEDGCSHQALLYIKREKREFSLKRISPSGVLTHNRRDRRRLFEKLHIL